MIYYYIYKDRSTYRQCFFTCAFTNWLGAHKGAGACGIRAWSDQWLAFLEASYGASKGGFSVLKRPACVPPPKGPVMGFLWGSLSILGLLESLEKFDLYGKEDFLSYLLIRFDLFKSWIFVFLCCVCRWSRRKSVL